MQDLYLIRFGLAALLLLAAGMTALGQTAQVTGRVSDQAGAIVPAAQIVVTNTGTGISRESVTNSEGYYTVPLLRPGDYRSEVKKAGFKPIVQTGVTLQVEQVLRLDYTLETGQVTESVNVTGTAVALETETSSLGKLIDQQRIQNLPLLGRNPYSLVALVPGARPSSGLTICPLIRSASPSSRSTARAAIRTNTCSIRRDRDARFAALQGAARGGTARGLSRRVD